MILTVIWQGQINRNLHSPHESQKEVSKSGFNNSSGMVKELRIHF